MEQESNHTENCGCSDCKDRRRYEYERQLDEAERRANGGSTYNRFDRPEEE